MFLRAVCAFALLLLCILCPRLRPRNRVRRKRSTYHATIDNVKYVYATAPPVAHLKPTNILDANSLDCFGNAIKKPGDTMALVKGDNPLTGPFYIDGAEPGDTLVVKVLDPKDGRRSGSRRIGAYFGAFNGTKYTAMIHPALPEKDLVLSDRSREQHRDVSGARFELQGEDSAPSVSRLHRRCAGRRAKRAARSFPKRSAGTWMLRKRRRATRFISR